MESVREKAVGTAVLICAAGCGAAVAAGKAASPAEEQAVKNNNPNKIFSEMFDIFFM